MCYDGVVLRRDRAHDGRTYWHLTGIDGRTDWQFLDYIIDCVDQQELNRKTVENRAYTLVKWYRYLATEGLEVWQASDRTLIQFRTALVERATSNCSGDQQARRRTVNLDLRNVYLFYAWLQKDPVYGNGRRLLGRSSCQITSTLVEDDSARRCSPRKRYPLTFRHAGEGSKHRMGFVPGETHRARLTEYFYDTFQHDLARRNCLLFELAWAVGWRRGSILSLTTADFAPVQGEPDADLQVAPSQQKFGYSNSFSVPSRIAAQVRVYVDVERRTIVERTGSTSQALFLNERTGEALTAGAVSALFSNARLALGWPKGSGLHAWRRGFTNAHLERELDARIELGLDTGGEALAMSIAHALGQESLRSQAAYVRDAQRRIRGTATFRDKEEHARLSDENALLRGELASLREALAHQVRGGSRASEDTRCASRGPRQCTLRALQTRIGPYAKQ